MKTRHVLALTPMLFLVTTGVCQAQKAVAEVQVAPAAITIQVGTTQKLLAVAYDAGGTVITTARYRWSSNNLNVARVDSTTGTVSAVAEGSAVVRAEAIGSGPPPRHGAAVITVRRRPT